MFLKAWNLSSGEVEIHAADCADTKRIRSRRKSPFPQDQVEFGKTDWSSKEAFCFDYWNNGILEEYEAEHGEYSFDIWQCMEFKPCTDSLQDNEPLEVEPEPAPKPARRGGSTKSTTPRATGYRAWATKPIPEDMLGFTLWIEQEFPDTFPDGIDPRTVAIALRTYRFFQRSDMSYKGRSGKHAAA
jgi:hypothetical protein